MPDEAETAEHNGDIWSRAPTKYDAILAGKNQRFLLGVTVKPIPCPKGKGQTTPLGRLVGLEYESGQSRNSGNRHFIA